MSARRLTPAVVAAHAVFDKLSDWDFFSDKVQHIYFYSDVDVASVAKLNADIQSANMSKHATGSTCATGPKAIVVHLDSRGGSVFASLSMMTIFARSLAPICVMVDGWSASAATVLSTLAPYRVAATPHVYSMIHQFGMTGFQGDRSYIDFHLRRNDKYATVYRDMYLNNTRLTAPDLDALLIRDKNLDTTFCMKHGLLDRVLDIDNRQHSRRRTDGMPLHVLMTKTNWNTFTVTCPSGEVTSDTSARLDAFLSQSPDSLKPVLYYCTPRCSLRGVDWLPIVARLRAFQVPVYSVVDAIVSIWDYLPALYCVRRYMYAHAILVVDVVYMTYWGRRLPDIVHNTGVIVGALRDVLRQRTRLPVAILDALSLRRFKFNAKECLAYGLCDEIVPLGGRRR